MVFSLVGGLGVEVAARRGLRAVLLVLVATWLRSAAGADGLREVFRRSLGRLRRLPAVPEAIRALDHIGSEGHLARAGRSLGKLVGETPFTVARWWTRCWGGSTTRRGASGRRRPGAAAAGGARGDVAMVVAAGCRAWARWLALAAVVRAAG